MHKAMVLSEQASHLDRLSIYSIARAAGFLVRTPRGGAQLTRRPSEAHTSSPARALSPEAATSGPPVHLPIKQGATIDH